MIRIEHGIRRSVLLESGGVVPVFRSMFYRQCEDLATLSQLDRTSDHGLRERLELFVSEKLAVEAVVG